MKAHLLLVDAPLPLVIGTQFGMCGDPVLNASALVGWTGETLNVREQVINFRGVCRKCKRLFLDRDASEGQMRKWLYALISGEESLRLAGDTE